MAGVFANHQNSILIRFVSREAATAILEWRVWKGFIAQFRKGHLSPLRAFDHAENTYLGPAKTPAQGYPLLSLSRLQDTTRFIRSARAA